MQIRGGCGNVAAGVVGDLSREGEVMNAVGQASISDSIWTYGAPLGIAVAILATGGVTLLRRLAATVEDLNYANEFRNRFIEYCNSRGENSEAYTWLTLNSARMQSEMGALGVYEAFKPPAASYMIRNYQIITNMLPELRHYIDQNRQNFGTMFASTIDSYMKAIDEALLRYFGVLQQREGTARRNLKNPLIWLRTGVEQVLAIPLLIFVWFGLVGGYTVRRLQSNILFKAMAVIATLVGLVSGVMTMVLGWDEFGQLTAKMLSAMGRN